MDEGRELEYSIKFLQKDLEEIKQDQKQASVSILEIRNILLEPENGIYSRVKDLEKSKRIISKFMWLLITGTVGIITTIVLKFF